MSTQTYTFDINLFSDLHKDAYGMRPNGSYFEWLTTATDAEKQKEWDKMCTAMSAREAERQQIEQVALCRFNKLVANTIADGAGDRETAIKWLMDAMPHAHGDVGFFEYTHGIPYGTVNGNKWC